MLRTMVISMVDNVKWDDGGSNDGDFYGLIPMVNTYG